MTGQNNIAGNVVDFISNGGRAARDPGHAGGRSLLERVRSHDWAATPLGPMDAWQEARRSVVDLVLASPMPMACLIGSGLTQIYNDAMADLPDAGEEFCLGHTAREAWPSDWPDAEALERARLGEPLDFGVVPRLERLSYAPLTPDGEEPCGVLVVAVPARARHTPTRAEIEHRTRNTLALLRSIITRSALSGTSVEEFAMHLHGRIEALARIQLADAASGHNGIDLETLIAEELQAATAHEGDQVIVNGPTMRVGFRAAEKLGLAIHELATNALKFGALAEQSGTVEVRWHIEGLREPALVLDWVERGVTGPVERMRDGFGAELIERALPYELSATTVLYFDPEGTRCTIRVPVSRLTADI